MASIPQTRTTPLYQKDSQLHTHTAPITSLSLLSSLPQDIQALFKPPQNDSEAYILTTPETIFHAQGGGQPSDTGTITTTTGSEEGKEEREEAVFEVHQVRLPPFSPSSSILHLGTFSSPDRTFSTGAVGKQDIDAAKRLLHSRLHTAGHVIGLAVNLLVREGKLDSVVDGKASHYPGAAFVEFIGLIPGSAKSDIQNRVDELVSQNLPTAIHFWTESQAQQNCFGVGSTDNLKGDVDGVRVVQIGELGSYPCGGTHVLRLGECRKVVVRGIKRQKGVSKIGYEVSDA